MEGGERLRRPRREERVPRVCGGHRIARGAIPEEAGRAQTWLQRRPQGAARRHGSGAGRWGGAGNQARRCIRCILTEAAAVGRFVWIGPDPC